MIFVTVGAQMPFDRMIRTVDEWAGKRNRQDVFAQIGLSKYRPKNIRFSQFINPGQFYDNMQQADTIVAHAGMGTIISAVERHKPILVMPRRSDLGETRNDHQVATARQFEAMRLVEVAMDEHALTCKLDDIDRLHAMTAGPQSSLSHCAMCPYAENTSVCAERTANAACPHLLSAVRAFLTEDRPQINKFAIVPGIPAAM